MLCDSKSTAQLRSIALFSALVVLQPIYTEETLGRRAEAVQIESNGGQMFTNGRALPPDVTVNLWGLTVSHPDCCWRMRNALLCGVRRREA